MKPSTLLLYAATAQAGVIFWPQQQHHAPGTPCPHHKQLHQAGNVQNSVSQSNPFGLKLPFFRHIRIIFPLSSRPLLPSPADIANQVFDKLIEGEEKPQQAELVQQEEQDKEVTILPYNGGEGAAAPSSTEVVEAEKVQEKEEEAEEGEAHEDLRRRKIATPIQA